MQIRPVMTNFLGNYYNTTNTRVNLASAYGCDRVTFSSQPNAQKKRIVVLLGPPGSGKGTHEKQVSTGLGIPTLGMGNILRSAIANGHPLASEIKKHQAEGTLVSTEIVKPLFVAQMEQPEGIKGMLLDGFPRNIEQAEMLYQIAQEDDNVILDVILFDGIPEDVLIDRMVCRETCQDCGKIYNTKFAPPVQEGICDNDGAKLTHRDDDNYETAKARLGVYHKQTEPIAEYFAQKGMLKVLNLTGNKAKDSDSLENLLFDE